MTDPAALPAEKISGRWWPVALVLIVAALLLVWLVRAAYWPCGRLDGTSGCVSSVRLDVSALGLDPTATRVEYQGFDLGPGGDVALVGFKSRTEAGWRILLALFDARTGKSLHTLVDGQGTDTEPLIGQVALSSDGTLAAAVVARQEGGAYVTSLDVYRVADGSPVRTVWSFEGGERADCTSLLDFSPDGRKLQCFTQVHDLESGAVEPITDAAGNYRYPVYASFSAMDAVAPDGTRADLPGLKSGIDLFDSQRRAQFAPDSTGLLVVSRAYHENRGQRFYTPPVFRRLSAVEVWDGKTRQVQRTFYANRRYRDAAWSQDSALFGLISADLQLDLFTR